MQELSHKPSFHKEFPTENLVITPIKLQHSTCNKLQNICVSVTLPVGHVVNEVLFKHQSPFSDGVKKCLFERTRINSEPAVHYYATIQFFHFTVQFLISVNLAHNKLIHLFHELHWKRGALGEKTFNQ